MFKGLVVKNAYGNKELRINDAKGGHVIVIQNDKDLRSHIGIIGWVASFTYDGVGGSETLRSIDDIDNNIEGIKRIRRISDGEKELLIDFLKQIREESVNERHGK